LFDPDSVFLLFCSSISPTNRFIVMKDTNFKYLIRFLEFIQDLPELVVEKLQPRIKWLYKRYSIPRGMVFAIDTLAVFLVFMFAYLLRFNFRLTDFGIRMALNQGLMATSIYALSSLIFQSYAGLLRYTTVSDILKVVLSTTYSFFLLLLISLLSREIFPVEFLVIPLSIVIIHYIAITLWHFFVRINVKVVYGVVMSTLTEKKRVLIYGAGAMGAVVKRAIESDDNCQFQVAGYIDDNPRLHGKRLDGILVYDPAELSASFVARHAFNVLIIGIKDLAPAKKKSVTEAVLDLGLEVLEPPSVDTWLNGDFKAGRLQKVKLEDLLGREPIRLSMKKIEYDLRSKVILVTGAAGSIGSEIVRQLTRFNARKLILIDQAETPMFLLENEYRKNYSKCPAQFILADVTNQEKMEQIFSAYRPDIVYHAAAYKHVPLMEENPHEAIRVNVGGTMNVSGLAMKYNAGKFVMISTDKAVNPTNVMGASKRICEMIVQLRAGSISRSSGFIITRFGNVLGSNGSVIPIFKKQIEEGGPVTVTHPDMTRFFMTIPEACQLVLEAGSMARGGEIFIFDMGEPVRIADLATQMIKLSGLVPGKDIQIEYTGLRPGEKLFEELFTKGEETCPTHHEKIKIAKVEKLRNGETLEKIECLLAKLYTLSKSEVIASCLDLVPEYKKFDNSQNVQVKTKAQAVLISH